MAGTWQPAMRAGVWIATLCVTALAGACGGTSKPATSTTAATQRIAPGATVTVPVSSTRARSSKGSPVDQPGPRPTTTIVVPQRPGSGELLSPSGNLSCEIDYGAPSLGDSAYCQTLSPPQSALLSVDGSVRVCGGAGCLGNAGVGTPTLPYGGSAALGPFRCESAVTGASCTISGRGFNISRSGIGPLASPAVDLAPGRYSGTVDQVSQSGSEMLYTIATTGCGAVALSGRWTISVRGARFVANSEPSTAQGEAVDVPESEWIREVTENPSWSLVATSGQPLEVTDGPTC